MDERIQQIFETLQNPGNPLYVALFLTLGILFFVFVIIRYILLPLQKKHLSEKREIELRNTKLMALFSELNPNPILRLNGKGTIINANDAGKMLTAMSEGKEINIKEIIPDFDVDLDDCIRKNLIFTKNYSIGNRYYSVLFRGVSVLGFGQLYLHDLTERKSFEEKLRESRSKLKELSAHLQDKIEEQRLRLSRELHDSIGQNLYLILLNIQKSEELFSDNGRMNEYRKLVTSVENTIKDLKEILLDLKPRMLEEAGLGPSIQSLCERVRTEKGIKGSFDINGIDNNLDAKLETALYRIAQEALSNIAKHSNAKEYNLQLIQKNNKIRMIISDDGTGFDPENNKKNQTDRKSYGLVNISERVEEFNGSFKIDSSPGNGTVLFIEIPLN
ncbi:MAG: hypothetical protein Kow0098_01570 [Ignavibacteriaceae bacterium]